MLLLSVDLIRRLPPTRFSAIKTLRVSMYTLPINDSVPDPPTSGLLLHRTRDIFGVHRGAYLVQRPGSIQDLHFTMCCVMHVTDIAIQKQPLRV